MSKSNTGLIVAGVVVAGGALLLWQRRAQAQEIAAAQAQSRNYLPNYSPSPASSVNGTGSTNPLTMLISGLQAGLTRLVQNTTRAGNAPTVPAAPSGAPGPSSGINRTPGAAPNPGAPGAAGGYLPQSPGLLLPNLGDPNQWYYNQLPDVSFLNNNVGPVNEVGFYNEYAMAPLANLMQITPQTDIAFFQGPNVGFMNDPSYRNNV